MPSSSSPPPAAGPTARRFQALPVVILLVSMAVFATVSVVCRNLFEHTEDRLLQQRTDEATLFLSAATADIRAPLDAAATTASVTNGAAASFANVMASSVGDGKSFTTAMLFRAGDPTPIAEVGAPSALPATGDDGALSMLSRTSSQPFVIVDLLHGDDRRLGYAVAGSGPGSFVVYGERVLSSSPTVRTRNEQPFSHLNYAIYLGPAPVGANLLGASTSALPLTGRTARGTVPFGSSTLTIVMAPVGRLSSGLFAALWWLVLVVGASISIAFTMLTLGLLRRRDSAIGLAAENERLYDEQREIAKTLQLSLLPHLDAPTASQVTARYWPAGAANLIGGDFYDVFNVDDGRWGITIGDVCGKGIEAAALTGLTRHTIRAAARRERAASDVLLAVHQALADEQPPTFCTACFVFVTHGPDGRQSIDLSLGGHPAPILRRNDGTITFVGAEGTLLGMVPPVLRDVHLEVQPGDTLLLFTDGLTDAPGSQAVPVEDVFALLHRQGAAPLDTIADSIRALKRSRRPTGSGDDTAVLMIRFGRLDDGPAEEAGGSSSTGRATGVVLLGE